MLENEMKAQYGKKKTSTVTTILFMVFSFIIAYAAIRWMAGTLTRQLRQSEPKTQAEQTEVLQEKPVTPEIKNETHSETEQHLIQAESEPDEALLPSVEESDRNKQEQPETDSMPGVQTEEDIAAAALWNEAEYTAKFTEQNMDVIFALATDTGKIDCLCILAVRSGCADLLAIPSNSITKEGRFLADYPAKDAMHALRQLLPIRISKQIVLTREQFAACADAFAPISVQGNELTDGMATLEYLGKEGAEPLLRSERFSHVLCSLPERFGTLSLLRLYRLKGEMEEAPETNIAEEEGWRLFHAVRTLQQEKVTARTLPVDSITVMGRRGYLTDAVLAKEILKKLFDSYGK